MEALFFLPCLALNCFSGPRMETQLSVLSLWAPPPITPALPPAFSLS